MKDKILNGARDLFVQYGIRSVSMDDVARTLSVSKKTLYQYFKNKDQLVTETLTMHLSEDAAEFKKIKDASGDALDELFKISRCLRESSLKVAPSLLYDLQKYHAEAYEVLQNYKAEFITGQIIENIEQGISEGLYRPEIDPLIIAKLRVSMVQVIFDQVDFPKDKFDLKEVHQQTFNHFVHGLLSDKGKVLYKEYQLLEDKPISE